MTALHHLRSIAPDNERISAMVHEIEDWQIVIPPEIPGFRDDCLLTYWLGATENAQIWFLAAARGELDPESDSIIAVSEPLSQDIGYISALLFNALAVVQQESTLSSEAAAEILANVQPPEYRPAGEYLPELPEAWFSLPCELVVGFTLSEGAHVSRADFKEYRRDSLADAMKVVKGKRHDGILIRYLLQTRGVVPFLLWDVDWPLARKGKEPAKERQKVQGAMPWEAEADTTLLEVYQHVHTRDPWAIGPPYFGEAAIWLRVGGRTPEEANENWDQCAKTLSSLTTKV
jgi:hypothetical protein